MSAAPLTRVSLLVRLRDPSDGQAWTDFVKLYAGVIYGFARKRGLQDADAADLMQEVLRSVAGSIGRWEYDPRKGTFRGWLYSISRNKIVNFLDAQRRQARGTGDPDGQKRIEEIPARAEDQEDWDREYERKVFHWAAERVRPEFQASTWKAFWMTAVEGKNAKEAGEAIQLSPGAVYVAKSRVLARLREEIQLLEESV